MDNHILVFEQVRLPSYEAIHKIDQDVKINQMYQIDFLCAITET